MIGPLYEAKTIKVCAPEDFVCSDGLNFAAHNPTAYDGSLTDQGADFAASRPVRPASDRRGGWRVGLDRWGWLLVEKRSEPALR